MLQETKDHIVIELAATVITSGFVFYFFGFTPFWIFLVAQLLIGAYVVYDEDKKLKTFRKGIDGMLRHTGGK